MTMFTMEPPGPESNSALIVVLTTAGTAAALLFGLMKTITNEGGALVGKLKEMRRSHANSLKDTLGDEIAYLRGFVQEMQEYRAAHDETLREHRLWDIAAQSKHPDLPSPPALYPQTLKKRRRRIADG